jgi:LacI family transcriptional regulator
MRNNITLKELAKLLNVSVSTVSKALNDSPEISQKTIERVKELAALHKYRPNPVAVNLKSSRSGTIGVIIPNISNSFFAKVLSGIEAKAQEEGLQVITYISNESLNREREIAENLTSGIVDGVLIAISEETNRKKEYDHLVSLVDYDIPVVLYDRTNLDIPVDKIGVDDEKSMEDATALLLSKGVKKIGLATSIHHIGLGKLRIAGYKKALKSEDDFLIANSSRPEVLREKTEALLLKEKVDALICTDFESTMLVYRIAHENSIKIPDDLKVIGFLGKELAAMLSPSISYIEQFPEKIGEKGMELLVKRIKKYTETGHTTEKIVKTELVELESTKF